MSNVAKPTQPTRPRKAPVKKPTVDAPVASADTTTNVAPTVEATPVAEPVTVAVDAAVGVVATEPTIEQEKKLKLRINDQTGTYISSARVRKDIDDDNLNKVNDAKAAEIKRLDAEYQTHVKASENKELPAEELAAHSKYLEDHKAEHEDREAQLAALARDRIRFSNNAAFILGSIADEMIKSLATHAMKHTVSINKKIVHIGHVHSAGVDKTPFYALVKDLPTFVAMAAQVSNEERAQQHDCALKAAAKDAEKAAKKLYGPHLSTEGKAKLKELKAKDVVALVATNATTADEPVVAHDDEEDADTLSYKYYIARILKDNKPKDVALRVSDDTKVYLSKLVDEFLERVANLIQLTTTNMKNKTVSKKSILQTVKALLIVGHTPTETLTLMLVDGKYTTVHEKQYLTSGYCELEQSVLVKVAKFKEIRDKQEQDRATNKANNTASDAAAVTAQ